MNRSILRDAVNKLDALAKEQSYRTKATDAAVGQFNNLLGSAKALYPNRTDILGMGRFQVVPGEVLGGVYTTDFNDAVNRLKHALDLRQVTTSSEALDDIIFPPDAPDDLLADLEELRIAIEGGLPKASLILAGAIAEALLLHRMSDDSDDKEMSPSIDKLINRVKSERLFGTDTRRNLASLKDYRDLIHPRTERRNNTTRDFTRVENAVLALKLLCRDLEYERLDELEG